MGRNPTGERHFGVRAQACDDPPQMLRYEGTLYRPPSEADSLILQATVGCSYNECTFCGMYRDKRFRVRKIEELKDEIAFAKRTVGRGGGDRVHKVFLADGDALVAKPSYLHEI